MPESQAANSTAVIAPAVAGVTAKVGEIFRGQALREDDDARGHFDVGETEIAEHLLKWPGQPALRHRPPDLATRFISATALAGSAR